MALGLVQISSSSSLVTPITLSRECENAVTAPDRYHSLVHRIQLTRLSLSSRPESMSCSPILARPDSSPLSLLNIARLVPRHRIGAHTLANSARVLGTRRGGTLLVRIHTGYGIVWSQGGFVHLIQVLW